MGDLKRVRTALGVAIVGLLVVALAPPGVSAGQPRASLTITPGVYVGGQALTFKGNIGRLGRQRIRLQSISDRPGDTWTSPEGGFHTWTNRDGSFNFTYPAPSMFGLRMRVVTAGSATPGRPVTARSQDLELHVVPASPAVGQRFNINVDTTPTFPNRSDLPGPAFQGRTLTLQQRVGGNRWQTLDTTTTDRNGQGSFGQTVNSPGTVVYRVRQEDWTPARSRIGWFPSFPTYVHVGAPVAPTGLAGGASASATRQRNVRTASAGTAQATARRIDSSSTASKIHRWGQSLWDFAWAFGESLTSRPYRGTDRQGRWLDASDGSGRAVPHNGQLVLESQRNRIGPGDHGTTSATLRGNPMTYGRWETKVWLKSPENNARDYRVRIELVPDRQPDSNCGVITVADVAAHDASVTMGATALRGTRKWTYGKRIGSLNGRSAAFAVEMTRRHISWFVNGRVMATTRSAAAVPDVPMTLRLSMEGAGQDEMNSTQVLSDWQRAFSLKRGKLTTSGHALRQGTYGGC